MNKEKFAIGDLVSLKWRPEEVGFIVEVHLGSKAQAVRTLYKIHWFQTEYNSWYNEINLIPKG